jgi:hypothetical protein
LVQVVEEKLDSSGGVAAEENKQASRADDLRARGLGRLASPVTDPGSGSI